MSLKKLIQAGAGVAALLGTAGTANALEVKVTTIGGVAGGDAGGVHTTDVPLEYAAEMQQGTLTDTRDVGAVIATFAGNKGNFPAGNLVVTATLTGAKFETAVVGGNLDFTNCTGAGATASLSSGGTKGGTTVSWVVSNLNNCAPGEQVVFDFDANLDLGGAGVSLEIGIVTESGTTPVDGGPSKVSNFLVAAPAYTTQIVADSTLIADVAAVGGAYTKFVAGDTDALGTVQLLADGAVVIQLANGVTAGIGNYKTASIVVAGDLSAFIGTGDVVSLAGVAATSKTAGTATFSAVESGAFSGAFTGASTIALKTSGDAAIPAAEYTITVTPTLETALETLVITPTSVSDDLAEIIRNGSSEVMPWVASGTQAGPDVSNTGAVHYIRVTNPTAADYGKVTATVLSSSQSASVGKTAVLATEVEAGAELLINSVALEPLLGSNFGRGDIEINVEGENAIIVQLVARPDGIYTIDNQ